MKQVQLKDVKKGEFIRRQPDAKTTFIRDRFVRLSYANGGWSDGKGRYSLLEWFGDKEIFLKGTTKVWIDFTF